MAHLHIVVQSQSTREAFYFGSTRWSTKYLRVVDETLSIPCVGWKLACAGLLETLNNGLQHKEMYIA